MLFSNVRLSTRAYVPIVKHLINVGAFENNNHVIYN